VVEIDARMSRIRITLECLALESRYNVRHLHQQFLLPGIKVIYIVNAAVISKEIDYNTP